MHLFEKELKEIFQAENDLVKALPLMIENAPSSEMIDALTSHLSETKEQVARLEEVFITFGKKAAAEKCEAISGLIKESEAIIQDSEEGSLRDGGIVNVSEEIEADGNHPRFSDALSLSEAIRLLKTTIEEEKTTD